MAAERSPRPVAPADPAVLELRIHGIGNTPPQGMLGVDADQIVRASGDRAASFWTTKDPTAAGGSDRRRVEAYSWGALARASSLPGLGFVAGVGQAVIRAGWAFLIPFGVANAAYWARRLPEDARRRRGAGRPAVDVSAPPFGAAAVRLFCLLLSLLLVATFAVASIDVVGTQCFGPSSTVTTTLVDSAGHTAQRETTSRLVCSHLPAAVRSMAGMTDGQRIALAAVVPALLLVLLVLLAWSGSVRFDQRMSVTRATTPTSTEAHTWDVPVLARTGFWRTSSHARADASLHVAGGLALVAALLAHQRMTAPAGGAALWPWRVLLALAVLLLLAVAVRVVGVTSGYPDVDGDGPPSQRLSTPPPTPPALLRLPWVPILLGASIVLLVAIQAGLAGAGDYLPGADPGRLSPTSIASDTVVTGLVGLLVLLCVVGIGLRRGVPGRTWSWLGAGAALAALCSALLAHGGSTPAAVVAACVSGALVVALCTVVLTARGDAVERPFTGWAGTGPAVFLALSAGLAVLMSSVIVVGLAAVLDAPAAPTCVTACVAGAAPGDTLTTPRGAQTTVTGLHHVLAVPTVFTASGYATLAVLLGLAIAAGVAIVRGLTAGRLPVRPGGQFEAVGGLSAVGQDVVLGARRAGALVQRAEIVVGALAALLGAALVAVLLTAVAVAADVRAQDFPPTCRIACDSTSLRTVVAALLAGLVAVMAGNVVAGSQAGAARPWGFLWDLQCFLPRAAHPFGPPCYSERVVPELRRRIDDWLEAKDDGAPVGARLQDPTKRVVLSAHSMGAVLAVSTLFARWDAGAQRMGSATITASTDARIALLTYGTQLRPFFGRFFPELFGPGVLGTRPCLAPRLIARDPWVEDGRVPLPTEPEAVKRARPTDPPPLSLLDSLGGRAAPRWLSLWRRTDFAGFPVDAYTIGPPRNAEEPQPPEWPEPPLVPRRPPAGPPRPARPIDRMAGEFDEDAYMFVAARHSDYPRSAAYRRAMDDLVESI
ncbi:hypothetical protein [Cellulomonas sp. ICMP 17802]|uniref:hypothetical protein n=1 Tax=Cellulomonas sp. ICMP 17802 TaxID=3239199 RepID=UPI00351AC399